MHENVQFIQVRLCIRNWWNFQWIRRNQFDEVHWSLRAFWKLTWIIEVLCHAENENETKWERKNNENSWFDRFEKSREGCVGKLIK